MNHLIVEVKNVYGNQVAYPVNQTAKTFAAIAGTKTLLPETLRHAKSLGFSIGFALNGLEVVPA